MPGRRLWSMPLVLVVLASLLSGPVGAQTDEERSTPIEVDRPSLGGLSASLAEAADGTTGEVTVRVDYQGPESKARQTVARAGGRVLAAGGQSFKVELPAAALRGLAKAPGIVSIRELIPPDPMAT